MIQGLFSNMLTAFNAFAVFRSVLEKPSQRAEVSLIPLREEQLLKEEQSRSTKPALSIVGCRGIPAKYGGFETFAERLAIYLTAIGWAVTVYCQDSDRTDGEIWEQYWKGIRLVQIPVSGQNAISSIKFDWKCILHAAKEKNLILTLGYNTAIFCFWLKLKGLVNLINMDGLEWQRRKWKFHEKLWLYVNERFGCWLGDHLIADHPEIKSHLISRVKGEKITVIPYGADRVTSADASLLEQYNLIPNEYVLVIARPEPENSILEIVSAFSSQPRGIKLVVLGKYQPETVPFHKQVMERASNEVLFPGAIYDPSVVQALRFYTKLYIHGHMVGGTNPSLVEALAAGSPILAHNNRFNSWVAGSGARYFYDQEDCAEKLDLLLNAAKELRKMRRASIRRYQEDFSSQSDVKLYSQLLAKHVLTAKQINPVSKGRKL